MKKLLPIPSILLATLWFTVSFAPGDLIGYPDHSTAWPAETDTSDVNQWIMVDSFDLAILPPSSGVRFYRDGIVFLSSTTQEKKMLNGHISFGKTDARYAEIEDTRLWNRELFSSDRSFPYPCDAVTFSRDFNIMYFTMYSKRDGVEKIYKAEFLTNGGTSGSWSIDEEPMKFCSGQYTYSHPALSSDGKLMVFASNQPGAVGGMDLFATIYEEGAWSDPVNLGNAVNTDGNELFPNLDRENNLYFSSDGIQGYGGYDIYVCKFRRNTWERPINLSSPINSSSDDVAFNVNPADGKTAFYTIKNKAGRRSQQLKLVRMNSSIPDTFLTLSQYFTNPDISPMVILALEPPVEATDIRAETERLEGVETTSGSDEIEYRVQFMTSFNPRTRSEVTIGDEEYSVFEYLYSGAYRLCIGEHSTLAPAIKLQNLLRKNGYPGASVIVFRNNILTLDPELLSEKTIKKEEGPEVPQKQLKETSEIAATAKGETDKTVPVVDAKKKTETVQKTITPKIQESKTVKAETTEKILQEPEVIKDEVVYRVQILSTSSSKGSYPLKIAGKDYRTYEYLYVGAYRVCVGEFRTLAPAKELQNVCRKNGYNQAFVVAFKNSKRSTDPSLFK